MQIAPEILSEKNYTGTRKIHISDEKVRKLKQELKDLQKAINPILDGLAGTFKKFDEANQKIAEHQKAIREVNDSVVEDKAFYDEEMKKIAPYEKKAVLIKDKLEPLVMKLIKDQLGEFEKPLHVSEDESTGDMYVEVVDQIEELVLKIRASKEKK